MNLDETKLLLSLKMLSDEIRVLADRQNKLVRNLEILKKEIEDLKAIKLVESDYYGTLHKNN